jgi:hypothetical protein
MASTLEGALALQALQSMGTLNEFRNGSWNEKDVDIKPKDIKKESNGGGNGSASSTSSTSTFEDEFICAIRPGDSSIPTGSQTFFQTYLSKASMVQHDRDLVAKDDKKDGSGTGTSSSRRSNPSASESSAAKTGTSSEAGSDSTGENESV